MVKFGKNKLKALNKLAKKQNVASSNSSSELLTNKVIKKKLNVDKKVTFQKEVLIRKAAESPLVKKISTEEIILNELSKKSLKVKKVKPSVDAPKSKKVKAVEKHRKRQKTQINDTKLLLKLMKNK